MKRIAMTNNDKHRMIIDFLEKMGVDTTNAGLGSDTTIGIYNSTINSMYSLIQGSNIEKDDVEQMFNLFLIGLKPSSYWTGSTRRNTDGVDKSQQFLSAFTDEASIVWNNVYTADATRTPAEEREALKRAFGAFKTVIRQRMLDDMRAEKSMRDREVSQRGNRGGDQDDAYESAMEGEMSRSVSVRETFNLNSWDEISAAANRDEKVRNAYSQIVALFESNSDKIARAVIDIAFAGARNADTFEYKLFQIGMGVGDFQTTVKTILGDIDIDQTVAIGRSPKLKSSTWVSNLADYLIVAAYPELRRLVVPELVGAKGKALKKNEQKLPANLRELAQMRLTRPFARVSLALPAELEITASEIFANTDATTVVGHFQPNQKYKNKEAVVMRNGIVACTPAMLADLRKAASTALNAKWIKGVRGRKKPFWKRGMDSIVRQIRINEDTSHRSWIDHDPMPSGVSQQTIDFVDFFRLLLTRVLIELNEAHGWYELRNKRFAKTKEAKTHRLASKVAYRWLVAQTKVGNLRNLRMKLMKDFLKLIRGKSQDSVYRAAQAVEKAFDLRVTPTDKWDVLDVMVDELTEWLMSPEAQDEPVDYHLDFAKEVFKSALR